MKNEFEYLTNGVAAVNYFPSRSYDTNETPESCAERE